ncbi:hypothetical protein OTU49_002070, partial [Cherax quadricarinatus]
SAMFHPRCGRCVHLSNGNKTAVRSNPTQEFNRGLIFSLEPIKDNEMFEVTIDKKLNTWSGSIEIGVTVCNPDVIDIPITATDLRGGTWIMLGQGVLRDGRSLHEAYGCDLDKLVEGDRVGVMRTSQGDLKFFVNGESQGVAAANLPQMLYAVVDMYGKCAQVTVTAPSTPDSNTLDEDSTSEMSSMRDSNILDSHHDTIPSGLTSINNHTSVNSHACIVNGVAAANLTSATSHGTCSALNNHVANISIANSLMSNSDSNVLHDERDGRESSCEASHNPSPRVSDAATPQPLVTNCGTAQTITINNCNNDVGSTPSGYTCGGAVGGSGGNNNGSGNNNGGGNNNNNNNNSGTNGVNIGANQAGNINPGTTDNMTNYSSGSDRLRFHEKSGTLVKLSNSARTAERRRPLDEFNNGVVMSCRALRENELFE